MWAGKGVIQSHRRRALKSRGANDRMEGGDRSWGGATGGVGGVCARWAWPERPPSRSQVKPSALSLGSPPPRAAHVPVSVPAPAPAPAPARAAPSAPASAALTLEEELQAAIRSAEVSTCRCRRAAGVHGFPVLDRSSRLTPHLPTHSCFRTGASMTSWTTRRGLTVRGHLGPLEVRGRGWDSTLAPQTRASFLPSVPADPLPPIPLDFPGSFDVLSPSSDSEGLSVFPSSLPSPANSPSLSPGSPTDSLDWLETLSGGPPLGSDPPAPSIFSADLSDSGGTWLWDLLEDPW